jgi:hypothetical protein
MTSEKWEALLADLLILLDGKKNPKTYDELTQGWFAIVDGAKTSCTVHVHM